jgi:hypothetical protein
MLFQWNSQLGNRVNQMEAMVRIVCISSLDMDTNGMIILVVEATHPNHFVRRDYECVDCRNGLQIQI